MESMKLSDGGMGATLGKHGAFNMMPPAHSTIPTNNHLQTKQTNKEKPTANTCQQENANKTCQRAEANNI